MESIGKEMVVQCKGLPLAVSTLGGILRDKMLRDWERINKDIKFHLAKGEGFSEYNIVTHVLGLSYDDLPLRLRQCFLCLANYKEDEVIYVKELYLFWIAEGLISSEDKAEGEMMLDVAEHYLDELANRSLVQVEAWEYEGESWSKYKNCSVHDLIRELCLSKVKEEKVIRVIDSQHTSGNDSESSNKRIRRLCIHFYDDVDESTVDENLIPQIRSLLLFNNQRRSNQEEKIFSFEKYKLLRVLTVQGFKLNAESLRSLGKLVYLKCLSFNWCEMVGELPSSIENLRNLETLNLRVINRMRIPNVLWKFKLLKYLYLPYLTDDKQEKVRLTGLDELEVIEGFRSDYCEKNDLIRSSKIKVFHGSIRVDDPMTTIENTIEFLNLKKFSHSSITIDDRRRSRGEVSLVLLLECSFIHNLSIGVGISALPKQYDYNRLSGSLISLDLDNNRMEEDPMILLEKLPNLRHLELNKSYMGREMVCSAMGFPQLESLFLYRLRSLTNWRVDEGAMPNLSKLQILLCKKLEMLPDGLRFLTSLRHLKISSMPIEFKDRIKGRDGGEGPDFYKVRHVTSIIYD